MCNLRQLTTKYKKRNICMIPSLINNATNRIQSNNQKPQGHFGWVFDNFSGGSCLVHFLKILNIICFTKYGQPFLGVHSKNQFASSILGNVYEETFVEGLTGEWETKCGLGSLRGRGILPVSSPHHHHPITTTIIPLSSTRECI